MATLTYNPDESQEGVLTADEQDSLAVGEQLAQEESKLLAGKYKDAEDLEKAYIELQQKLGDRSNEVSNGPEDSSEEETQEEEEPEEEQQEEVLEEEPAATFTDEDIKGLQNIVGGEEGYNELIGWAAESITPNEIEMFNNVIESGNAEAAYFAVHALRYAMINTQGYEGKLLTGKAPRETKDVYKSQAQVVRAMSDPRYDNDPAFRQEVMEKLERSNIEF